MRGNVQFRIDFNLAGVYKIENTTNGKVYIGSATDIEARLHSHMSDLHRGKHACIAMQRDYDAGNVFSIDVLHVEVLPEISGNPIKMSKSRDHLRAIEWEFMKQYRSYETGYNFQRVSKKMQATFPSA